jgi:hypothetical protein
MWYNNLKLNKNNEHKQKISDISVAESLEA